MSLILSTADWESLGVAWEGVYGVSLSTSLEKVAVGVDSEKGYLTVIWQDNFNTDETRGKNHDSLTDANKHSKQLDENFQFALQSVSPVIVYSR